MDSLPHSVLEALRAGNKLEAIKRLRNLTGLGLKEAKDRIDAHAGGAPLPATEIQGLVTRAPETSFAHFDKAIAALKGGNKIEAIRILRMAMEVGLAEAKAMVEKMEKEMPAGKAAHPHARARPTHHARGGLAPGEVPHTDAPGKWLVLFGIAVIAIVAALYY